MKCLAHRLHRVAEAVRGAYAAVDKLVAAVKKLFRKSPLRQEIFNLNAPLLPLPPRSNITRWVTWLKAVFYYDDHFDKVQRVVNLLPDDNRVRNAQEAFAEEGLREDVQTIAGEYRCITRAIVDLGEQCLPLRDAITIMNNVSQEMRNSPDVVNSVQQRMTRTITSPEYQALCQLDQCHQTLNFDNRPENWTGEDVMSTRYIATTTCDVERCFSILKYILSDRRMSMTIENLRMYFINKFFTE